MISCFPIYIIRISFFHKHTFSVEALGKSRLSLFSYLLHFYKSSPINQHILTIRHNSRHTAALLSLKYFIINHPFRQHLLFILSKILRHCLSFFYSGTCGALRSRPFPVHIFHPYDTITPPNFVNAASPLCCFKYRTIPFCCTQ